MLQTESISISKMLNKARSRFFFIKKQNKQVLAFQKEDTASISFSFMPAKAFQKEAEAVRIKLF